MLRLRVAEYFDSVVNQIDLYTETKIQSIKTQTEENWWNKRRQEQIDEVRRIERACLDHVNKLKVEEKEIESGEWMKRAFVEYCFTVDYADLLYLAKANRLVDEREQRLLKAHLSPKNKTMNVSICNQQSVGVTILASEFCLDSHFLTDNPVVDISTGLDKCGRIKRACISDTSDTEPSLIHFEDFLSIEDCKISFDIESADQDKKAVDVIKYLMSRLDRIEEIGLSYEHDIGPSQEMKALAQSDELNDRVKFDFFKRHGYVQEFGLKYINPINGFVLVTNWQFISGISINDARLEDLEKVDLSSLHSLNYLNLNILSTDKSSSDWKFLDVCRSSLEEFQIKCELRTTPFSLSSSTFRGMTNLKRLSLIGAFSVELDDQEQLFGDLNQLESLFVHSTTKHFVLSRKRLSGMFNLQSLNFFGSFILTDSQGELFADLTQLERLQIFNCDCTTLFPLSRKTFCSMTNLKELELRGAFSNETNNQEELFADLIHLKMLDISLNEQALTTKWLIYSPTVEELRLSFKKSPKVANYQIRFKLPQLSSLQLCFYCDRIECDLTYMMSCFSHVKKLKIYSRCFDIMTKGWFHRLTSVKELEVSIESRGHINSQLFEEFNHLTKLRICIWPENTVDHCALHKLVHLESIALVNCRDQDKSMFDGLNSLKIIEYRTLFVHSRAYVYFENLDRFILILK